MKNVYVIKVKTKPPLSSLYPSERRYSASTVGGLCLVHFGLAALSLLLGSLALSLQGPILSVACLAPFASGLLAWRRWYVDRNIAIFFYSSLFSLVAATLCFVATALDVAAAARGAGSLWTLERILQRPAFEEYPRNDTLPIDEDAFDGTTSSTVDVAFERVFNVSGYVPRTGANDSLDLDALEHGFHSRNDARNDDNNNNSSRDSSEANGRRAGSNCSERNATTMIEIRREDRPESSPARILLTVNVLIASLLEAVWSALSARIALRGMTNRLPDTGRAPRAADKGNGKPRREKRAGAKRKPPPPPGPDVLQHDRRLAESLRNFGPRLPLPESSREFRERVERFLANQAAHRVAEGSCS